MAEQGLSREQRTVLFDKLRYEPQFRELMKENWKLALKEVGIKSEEVIGGIIKRQEIEEFAQQTKGWDITIEFSGRTPKQQRVQVNEAVVFKYEDGEQEECN